MNRLTATFIACVLVFATLPGCASKYGEQKTTVNYYPACYQPIHDLRNDEHAVGRSTAGGALIGALGGALVGLLAGQGRAEDIIAGAAIGGVAGTMVGYGAGSGSQQAEANRRMASYLEQLDGDISSLDLAHAAARTSLQCYDTQFRALVAAIKSGRITRQAATQRYDEIRTGREEAIAILGDAAYRADELDARYEEAFVREAAATPPGTATAQRVAYDAARKRKQSLTRKATDLRQTRQTAKAGTVNQDQELNRLLAQLDDIRR